MKLAEGRTFDMVIHWFTYLGVLEQILSEHISPEQLDSYMPIVKSFAQKGLPADEIARQIFALHQQRDQPPETIQGRGRPKVNKEETILFLKKAFAGTKLEPRWSEERGWGKALTKFHSHSGLYAKKQISVGEVALVDQPLSNICIADGYCCNCIQFVFSFLFISDLFPRKRFPVTSVPTRLTVPCNAKKKLFLVIILLFAGLIRKTSLTLLAKESLAQQRLDSLPLKFWEWFSLFFVPILQSNLSLIILGSNSFADLITFLQAWLSLKPTTGMSSMPSSLSIRQLNNSSLWTIWFN